MATKTNTRKPTIASAKQPRAAPAKPAWKGRSRNGRAPLVDGVPIVGIGASAGGLEALERFFGQVPRNSGIAFVIVQHLDPNHKALMPQLLERSTGMSVTEAKNRVKALPNRSAFLHAFAF